MDQSIEFKLNIIMKILITRQIPNHGINMLKEKGYEVTINPEDRPYTKEELLKLLIEGEFSAVLCDLDDKITAEVLGVAKEAGIKIFANYAVGYDNLDIKTAQELGIFTTNTPGALTNAVAEHAMALLFAVTRRVVEADRYMRAGKFHSWGPMLFLGGEISGKTMGIVGLGRIGSRVAYHAKKGFDMNVLYYDVKRSEAFEKEIGAEFRENPDDVFKEADFISVHVPLLPTTKYLIDARRLSLMKKTAYLINTSRGPVVDEEALVESLKNKAIAGAALDVFEHEPAMAPGLAELENVVITPHIASATGKARQEMSEIAAKNIIEVLDGRTPPNVVRV